ncbi:XRE family transcriptional regulator [Ferruginibacter sp. HRS2-29]|nr:XRE family transcriptional regulator [Ferruginibacter sp. HRS2-29]
MREDANLSLKEVASQTKIDFSLLAKIERNQRQATKEQVRQIAFFYNIDEKNLLKELLSDQLAYKMIEEKADVDVFKVAEEKIEYLKANKNGK